MTYPSVNIANIKYLVAVPMWEYIRVDRHSVLGNPFELESERQRDAAVNAFDAWFEGVILNDSIETEPFAVGGLRLAKAYKKRGAEEIQMELLRLCLLLASGKKLTLLCWCAPKNCHARVILRYLQEMERWIGYLSDKLGLA